MSKISVLMTVYNEADFIDYAIRSCLPFVDDLVIVEGAYKETVALGKPERSTDGTIDIIEKYKDNVKVHIIYANEHTDKDQRNIGLNKIKEINHSGWLLIIDGDEIYDKASFKMVNVAISSLERNKQYAAYFKSLTFVNDINHYTEQEFPRLFKLTPECTFINDNFMAWKDASWTGQFVTKIPYIRYFHYSFCKGKERFELKKKWWETRFGKEFDYGWHINKDGRIDDKNHKIMQFKGHHPEILQSHKIWWEQDVNG